MENLASSDPFERKKATQELAQNSLSAQKYDVPPLLDFFTARIQDPLCSETCISTILSLLNKLTIPYNYLNIAFVLVQECNISAFAQPVRFQVYSIFEFIIKNCPQETGNDDITRLVQAWIHAMEGEKDPRNLMLAFKICKLIVQKGLLPQKFTKDLFEVCFCYFPITFNPSPDDPIGVTSAQLKEALQNVILSTDKFAVLFVPEITSKLNSESWSAKRDSINILLEATSSLPLFGTFLLPHLKDIWEGLRSVIISPHEEIDQESALQCLKKIATCLSQTPIITSPSNLPDSKSPLDQLVLDLVIPLCMEHISKPSSEFVPQCGKILIAVASSCSDACHSITEYCFLKIHQLFESEHVVSRKNVLLLTFIGLMNAARRTNSKNFDCFLDTCLETLVTTLSSSKHVPLKNTCVSGLFEMAYGLDSDPERLRLVMLNLNASALNDMDTAPQTLMQFKGLVSACGGLVRDHCLNDAVAVLKSSPSSSKLDAVLKFLETISSNKEKTFPLVVEIISEFAIDAFSNPEMEGRQERSLQSFQTLQKIISNVSHDQSIDSDSDILETVCCTSMLPKLYECPGLFKNPEIATSVNKIHSLLMENVSDSCQLEVVKRVVSLVSQQQSSISDPVVPHSTEWALLYSAVLCYAKPKVDLAQILCINSTETPSLGEFMKVMINDAISKSLDRYSQRDFVGDEQFLESTGKLCSSFLNKHLNECESSQFIQRFTDEAYLQLVSNDRDGTEHSQRFLNRPVLIIYSYLAKALIMQSKSLGLDMARRVLELIPVLDLADDRRFISKGIEIMIKDDESLSRNTSFANERFLYKQKFYSMLLPLISEEYSKIKKSMKGKEMTGCEGEFDYVGEGPYLKCLATVLCNIPANALRSELPALLPMLLSSLRSTDQELKVSTLDSLEFMMTQNLMPKSQVPSLLSNIFDLCTYSDSLNNCIGQKVAMNSPRVRFGAMKLLELAASRMEFTDALSMKPQVLKVTLQAVGDQKRVVREAAARVRKVWFLLSSK